VRSEPSFSSRIEEETKAGICKVTYPKSPVQSMAVRVQTQAQAVLKNKTPQHFDKHKVHSLYRAAPAIEKLPLSYPERASSIRTALIFNHTKNSLIIFLVLEFDCTKIS
jgi:hypothetical protein